MTDHDLRFFEDLAVDVLARTMWGEARGEGDSGLIAVAQVVLNRVALARERGGSWWGHDIISVCQKPFQFSCWNRNDANFEKVQGVDKRNPEFRRCLTLARQVMRGGIFDETDGATHYHRFDILPRWAKGKTPTVRINHHMFYSMPEEV